MKICLDGFPLTKLEGTSMYSYTFEYFKNLFKYFPQPDYHIIWDDSERNYFLNCNKKNKLVNLNIDRSKNDFTELEKHIIHNKINIYHSLNNGFSIPENKNCKTIVTIYDLLPMENLGYVDEKYFEKFLNVFPNTINEVDEIIAVSKFIKSQIVKHFNVDERKINVVYPGISKRFKMLPKSNSKKVCKKLYNIDEDFILYAGSLHARKNLHILLRILKYIKKYKYTKNIKMVIAGDYIGKRNEYFCKLRIMADKLGIGDSVIFTGKIHYKNMPYLYNASECFVNFSEYDGFPLSSLEAMACGIPIVSSNTLFNREVIENGGLLVDLEDELYLKDAILEVIMHKKYRESIIENGLVQAKKYSWNKNIKSTVKIYENLI
ncbi:glycosyltransferase family 1 protein [Clostridium sediminicola]|uniref:glycosyltransferase family 4 protein n=1 Tax=Clostridium sediminicola TaxID=3114879 RepID=UPI0031F1F3B1